VHELRQANEILRKASVFARAELDRIRRNAWLRAYHIHISGEPHFQNHPVQKKNPVQA